MFVIGVTARVAVPAGLAALVRRINDMGFWHWIVDKCFSAPEGSDADPSRGGHATSVDVMDSPDNNAETDADTALWWCPDGASVTEPVVLVRPDLTMEARALENLLISHFDGHDLTMPPLLPVAQKLLADLNDPTFGLSDAAKEVADDQVLAAAVLRMANSPLFRGLSKTTTLQPAVTRIGARPLRTLVMHESLRTAMFAQDGYAKEFARPLWVRSLASACIMREFAPFVGVDRDQAFLIGLMHDIGCVIALRIVQDKHVASRYPIDGDTFDYLCDETHQEFGELVADAWNLPADAKSIISDHHTHPAADDPLRNERLLVLLTDMTLALLHYRKFIPYDLVHTNVAVELGIDTNDDFLVCMARLPALIEETLDAL